METKILDDAELSRELRLLERRPRPGGKTVVDHPSHGHDDHSNALAISAVNAAMTSFTMPVAFGQAVASRGLWDNNRDEGVA